ncbi:hypothetical protein CI109_103877 [Kwoniella shandongensis]|uniref:Uncharacterized protein n=1 Tax=Kwoniella shandongensis TaxID=1734106 RepID=A0A5M6CAS0_9TREE|nr:uncharacterized protein CI109_000432 [Kwoniella shandongensis]KAA5530862.1 hypothetical protein CI109_000432 [Kwoniella shandongensis]
MSSCQMRWKGVEVCWREAEVNGSRSWSLGALEVASRDLNKAQVGFTNQIAVTSSNIGPATTNYPSTQSPLPIGQRSYFPSVNIEPLMGHRARRGLDV